MALVTRESQGVIRNKHALVARFGISGFMNLFFSLIFYQVGTASTNCPGFECTPSIQDHFGAVCNVAIGLLVSFPSRVQTALCSQVVHLSQDVWGRATHIVGISVRTADFSTRIWHSNVRACLRGFVLSRC